MALHFSLEPTLDDDTATALAGLSVFLPIGMNEVIILSLLDRPQNRDTRVLEMIRMVESAAAAWPGAARFTAMDRTDHD